MPNPNANAACSSTCSIGPGERIGAFPEGAASAADPNRASMSLISIRESLRSSGLKRLRLRRPRSKRSMTAPSVQSVSAAVSSRWRRHWQTSSAMPCAMRAGRPSPSNSAARGAPRPFASAGRRAGVSDQPTRSTSSSKTATGSSARDAASTRRKAQLFELNVEAVTYWHSPLLGSQPLFLRFLLLPDWLWPSLSTPDV